MYGIHRVPAKYISQTAKFAYYLGLALLLFTWFFGAEVNGAGRWIRIPFINLTFQSSDFAKLALIIYVSKLLVKKQQKLDSWKDGIMPLLLPIGATCVLILKDNFSTSAMLFMLSMIMLFIGRVPILKLFTLAGAGIVAVLLLVGAHLALPEAEILPRYDTWMNRINNRVETAEQSVESLQANQQANNAKLAKINLAIHGIEGKITETNSFYSDPHNLVGKCDFVMANPPFNVNKIDKDKDYVKNDPRLPFGLPKADNGNYLWMQYFHSYLNKTGRAGFVMASSATDAGHSEKLIRQKLIESGDVDCIVAVGNNFFYTRSLPCHLWFYDKGKRKENKDKILMIDARNVFRKVSTTINDFSDEQLEGLTAIVKMYRGENPTVSKNNTWFNERFANGKYEDIEGLCKVVTLDEVKDNDYSLTPGRYVGVTFVEDDGVDYEGRLVELQTELDRLNEESILLARSISKNLKELI
jgi:hypothetical protein